jgi:predicted Zn-dependent protease
MDHTAALAETHGAGTGPARPGRGWGTVSRLRRSPGRVLAALGLLALLAGVTTVACVCLRAQYHLRAARLALERGHTTAAVEHLRACRRFFAGQPEVLLLSARAARRGGGWIEAEALLDEYWRRHGDDEALVLERLLLRANRGELEAVGPLLQARIDQDDPCAPAAREALVAGLLARERLQEAGRQIDGWLAHDPDSTLALLARGKLEEQRLQDATALESYRRLLEIDPEGDDGRLRLAEILVRLSQGDEAAPHLRYLRGRLPGRPEVLVPLARALDLQGRGAEALAVLEECLAGHPDHAAALAERGRVALRDGDNRAAEEYLARAVRRDPGNVPAHYQYFRALKRNGKEDEAGRVEAALKQLEADYRRINELVDVRLPRAPKDPAVPHEVATILLRAGRLKEAHRWLVRALQVDPDYLPAHRSLAAFYYQTGNPILAGRHRAIAQRLAGRPKG